MLVGLFFNEVMFLGGIIFWAMPLGRASADNAALKNILWMVPLRILRIPRANILNAIILVL